MLLKYVYVFSRVTGCTWCEARGREFFVCPEFRMVNVDVSLSLLRDYFICIDGCLI